MQTKTKPFILIIFLWCVASFAGRAFSQAESRLTREDVLNGKVGVAGLPSVDSAYINPAQAAFIRHSEVQVGWGLLSSDYKQRYAGFKTHHDTKTGADGPAPIPKFIYKVNNRLGIGGMIIPFPLKQKISVQEMPVVILNQENLVDLEGEGALNAYANLIAGYALSRSLSLGLNFSYLSFGGEGKLITSGSGNEIATFKLTSTNIKLGAGVKAIFGRIVLGLATNVVSVEKNDANFDAGIALGEKEDNGQSTSSSEFLNPIRFGAGYEIPRLLSASMDIAYRRAQKGKKRYSVVDFATKEMDLYDTWSVYTGLDYRTSSRFDLLAGYFNEPSAVGPGKKGTDEKTGFGFLDVAENLGEPPGAPLWMLGFGARYHFGEMMVERKSKKGNVMGYNMALEFGVAYGETSIGIDEDGEQPGAYLVRRYKLPLKYSYRF